MSEEIIIEFEGVRNNTSISGWMYLKDADCDAPLNFYDHLGFEIGERYPKNPYHEYVDGVEVANYKDFETLKYEMMTDDELIALLVEYATESKTVDRGKYNLLINGGNSNV